MEQQLIELQKPIAEVSDAELLAAVTGSAEPPAEAAPTATEETPTATEETPANAPEGENAAGAEAEGNAEVGEQAGTTEGGEEIAYDEFVKKFADKRIVMEDGKHLVKDLLTSHSYVQRKLADARKQTETAVAEAVEPLKGKAEKFDAITTRLQRDRIGLAVDAMCIGLNDQAKAEVERFAAENFGWSRDGSRAAVAEAQLEAAQKPKETGRTSLQITDIRNELELTLQHEFKDTQWSVVYGRASQLESKGQRFDEAVAQSIAELYPDVLEAYQKRVKAKPAAEPKKKNQPQAERPGARVPRKAGLEGMSDTELMALGKQLATA